MSFLVGKKNLNNSLKLSKIFNLRICSFIGKDPCLASIYGISRLSVLRCEVCFFWRWWETCNKNISTSFWLGKKNPKHQKMSKKNGKASRSQWSLVLKRAHEHVRKEKTFQLAVMQVLFYFIFKIFFFYSNIIWLLNCESLCFSIPVEG